MFTQSTHKPEVPLLNSTILFSSVNPSTQHNDKHKQSNELSCTLNLDINAIRESAYKLPWNHTKTLRRDHSLEAKSPLKYLTKKDHENQVTFRETVQLYEDLNATNHKAPWCGSTIKAVDMNTNSLASLYELLQSQNMAKIKQSSSKLCNIEEEEIKGEMSAEDLVLAFINRNWLETESIKQKNIFIKEMESIESILKCMIIKLAKHKLSHLQLTEYTNNHLQVKQSEVSYRKREIITQRKGEEEIEMKKEDNQKYLKHTKDDPSLDTLEVRKIKYILEDLHRKSKQEMDCEPKELPQDDSKYEQVSKEDRLFEENSVKSASEATTIKNIDCLSSFNRNESPEESGLTLFEIDKESPGQDRYINIDGDGLDNKIYMKNIVKKAIKPATKLNNKAKMVSDSSKAGKQYISNVESEFPHLSLTTHLSLITNPTNLPTTCHPSSTRNHRIDSPVREKRAALNDIINMLNEKYNKNIKLPK